MSHRLLPTVQTLTTTASDLSERLTALWERTGDPALHRLAVGGRLHAPLAELTDFDPDHAEDVERTDPQSQEFSDWVSTALMDAYRKTGDSHVFALLYEINAHAFAQAIHFGMRRTSLSVDEGDVLQEVFLNIFRYPHRFVAEKADAFRNWGHRIVRNTLLKALKGEGRRVRTVVSDSELLERADVGARGPDRSAAEAEMAGITNRAFILYLNLYWLHFQKLSAKEQRALRMVEIDGASYKETAAALGIRLENLKMVIFRGRRKVLRGMDRSLRHLTPPA